MLLHPLLSLTLRLATAAAASVASSAAGLTSPSAVHNLIARTLKKEFDATYGGVWHVRENGEEACTAACCKHARLTCLMLLLLSAVRLARLWRGATSARVSYTSPRRFSICISTRSQFCYSNPAHSNSSQSLTLRLAFASPRLLASLPAHCFCSPRVLSLSLSSANNYSQPLS